MSCDFRPHCGLITIASVVLQGSKGKNGLKCGHETLIEARWRCLPNQVCGHSWDSVICSSIILIAAKGLYARDGCAVKYASMTVFPKLRTIHEFSHPFYPRTLTSTLVCGVTVELFAKWYSVETECLGESLDWWRVHNPRCKVVFLNIYIRP